MSDLKKMIELTVSLHKLILHGIDESDAGEAIRDESDNYWHKLSEEDKDWLRNFSASLYDMTEELQNSLRWIPVTEQLPPDKTDVDFLCVRGYDGYGHMYRQDKVWNETYNLPHDSTPTMVEYEGGPYKIGKDDFGNWGVTHWRLRPGIEPDFDKFFEDNK